MCPNYHPYNAATDFWRDSLSEILEKHALIFHLVNGWKWGVHCVQEYMWSNNPHRGLACILTTLLPLCGSLLPLLWAQSYNIWTTFTPPGYTVWVFLRDQLYTPFCQQYIKICLKQFCVNMLRSRYFFHLLLWVYNYLLTCELKIGIYMISSTTLLYQQALICNGWNSSLKLQVDVWM